MKGEWFLRLGAEWALIVGSMAAAAYVGTIPAYVAAAAVVGTRQFALGVLAHDGAHGHAGKWGHRLAEALCFWPLGIGIDAFKRLHWAHHGDVGGPRDPEMPVRRRQEALRDRIGQWPAAALDLVGGGLRDTVAVMRSFRAATILDVAGPLALHITFWLLGAWPIWAMWYGALGTSFMATFRLRGYTEHQGTITFRKSQPALWRRALYLPHLTWLHWEHHRWPALPARKLLHRHQLEAQ